VSGDAPRPRPTGALARRLWLLYALASVCAALILLAVYVNTYDDYDVGDRLRTLGGFTRRAMLALGFPLSLPASLLTGPLDAAFGCGDADEPCAVFVMWQTLFATLVTQVAALRLAIGRRWPKPR
jgi:hypothetical protein